MGGVVNSPTWYISVLLLCYVVYYLVTVIAIRWKTKPLYLYIFMALLGYGLMAFSINFPFFNGISGRGYLNFFIGVLLAAYIKKFGVHTKNMMVALAVIIFTLLFIRYEISNYGKFRDYMWLSFGFYPSMIIILESKYAQKLFCHKFISFLSKTTFDTYIWHLNIIIALMCVKGLMPDVIDISDIRTEIGFVAAALVIGILSYFFVESPITKWLELKEQRKIK